jgi:thioredoxin reductase (NADPH)
VKTGPDLSSDELANANWPLARPPNLLETSRPRIFAVGNVRGTTSSAWHLLSAKDRSP